MSNIKFNGVNKSFGSNKIITDFSLLGKEDEFLVLVGPSGCGKSTLLRMIAGEINEDSADAIFLSCGGIRSTEVIDQIEQKTGKPVITSNQAQMWSCLRRAGVEDKISGFGKLFNYQLNI